MSKTQNTVATVEANKVETTFDGAAYIKECGSVSAAVRKLAAEHKKADGKPDTGKIAKMLGKRFQHVRNVLVTPIKKAV